MWVLKKQRSHEAGHYHVGPREMEHEESVDSNFDNFNCDVGE